MTKERADGSIESGCWTEAFSITLGGPMAWPEAHGNSGRDDKRGGWRFQAREDCECSRFHPCEEELRRLELVEKCFFGCRFLSSLFDVPVETEIHSEGDNDHAIHDADDPQGI